MGRWAQYRKRGRAGPQLFLLDPPTVPEQFTADYAPEDGGTLHVVQGVDSPDGVDFVLVEFWHTGGDHNQSTFAAGNTSEGFFVDGTSPAFIFFKLAWGGDAAQQLSPWSAVYSVEAP